jgi:hypothetical protein
MSKVPKLPEIKAFRLLYKSFAVKCKKKHRREPNPDPPGDGEMKIEDCKMNICVPPWRVYAPMVYSASRLCLK